MSSQRVSFSLHRRQPWPSASGRPGEVLAEFNNQHTLAIEPKLKTLKTPALIVWGTDDIYFDVKWAYWLLENIPATRRRIEFEGARIFSPEERWEAFNSELRNQAGGAAMKPCAHNTPYSSLHAH